MSAALRRTYSQITLDERRKIERWHAAKVSVDILAEKLGRHRSTIFRALRRNGFEEPHMPELARYYCVTSHDKARARRSKLRKLVLPAVSFLIDVHSSWFSQLLPRGE